MDEEEIAQVVAMWTGIPVNRIAQEESERLLESAIASADDAATNYNLANAKIALGKPQEALKYAEQALKKVRATLRKKRD